MNLTSTLIDFSYYLVQERRLTNSLTKALEAERFDDAVWLRDELKGISLLLEILRGKINKHNHGLKMFDMDYFKEIEFLEMMITKSCEELIYLQNRPSWMRKQDWDAVGREDPVIGIIRRSEFRLEKWKEWLDFLKIRLSRLEAFQKKSDKNHNEEIELIQKLLNGAIFDYYKVKDQKILINKYSK